MLSIALFSSLWGVTDLCAFLRFDDPLMQMFVVVVQSLWVGASTVRNAASPAAMYAQIVVTSVPTIVGAGLSHSPLILMLLPFLVIQYGAIGNAARYTGRQIALMLVSDQRLEAANARLTQLSATDGLTGIGNRRAFDATLQTEWARAARDASDLGLLVIDADHFKSFNDRYGHPAGDECLRLIAEVTERTLRRPPDFAARFGGEEFVALLPGTDEAGARDVAERVRLAVQDANMAHEGNPSRVRDDQHRRGEHGAAARRRGAEADRPGRPCALQRQAGRPKPGAHGERRVGTGTVGRGAG